MKLAFVFPGQGSQTVGMMDSFAENAVVQQALKTANEALGEDLAEMIHTGPAESLNMTVNTQPAMLTSSVAIYQSWLAMGGKKPEVMAGHSLGEYSALTAAGVFSLADAVRLVRFRAKVMQEAVPVGQGGMAAIIGLSDEAVAAVCAQAASCGVVEAVNFNSPGQVVIAGEKAADMAHPTGKTVPSLDPAPVCGAVKRQRVQPRIAENHLPGTESGRVSLENGPHIFLDALKHCLVSFRDGIDVLIAPNSRHVF